jgi:PAS domain S-box-containing protein
MVAGRWLRIADLRQAALINLDDEVQRAYVSVRESRLALIIGPVLLFLCTALLGQMHAGAVLLILTLIASASVSLASARAVSMPSGSKQRRIWSIIFACVTFAANSIFVASVTFIAMIDSIAGVFSAAFTIACSVFQMLQRYRNSPVLTAVNLVPYLGAMAVIAWAAYVASGSHIVVIIALAALPLAAANIGFQQFKALRLRTQEIDSLTQTADEAKLMNFGLDVALRAANGGFSEFDLRTMRHTRISKHMHTVTGIGVDEIKSNPMAYFDRISEADKAEVYRLIESLPIDGRTSFDVEHDYKHPDGEVRKMRCVFIGFWHEAAPRLLCMAFDQTAQRQAEQSLQAARKEAQDQQERWEIAAASAGAAVCEYDLENRKFLPSARYEELIGTPIEALNTVYGGSMHHLIPEPWRSEVAAAITRVAATKSNCTLDYPVDRPDGRRVWLRSHTAMRLDHSEGRYRAFCFNVDMTDVREAEEASKALAIERQREWQQLYENSAIAQNVWDGSDFYSYCCELRDAGIALTPEALAKKARTRPQNANTRTLFSNAAARALFGIYDKSDLDHAIHFPSPHAEDVFKALEGWEVGAPIGPFKTVIARTNGEVRNVIVEIRPIGPDSDPWSRCISSFIDVTEQVRAKAALAEAKDEAENANRAKSEFLAAMSHEIRTPMNAILGMGEMLAREPLSETAREHVETLRSSGQLLLTVLNDLLDLSKIEAGRMDIESIPTSLSTLLGQVEQLWSARAEEKGLQFSITSSAAVPAWFMGDPSRLQQIIFNLVSNAVKFTDAGSIQVNVNAGQAVDGKSMLLSIAVEDTGVGLSDAAISRLFNPFTQADASTSRRYGGTGLGLTISKRLAEAMGGTIEVQSSEGAGSTFTVLIPVDLAEAQTGELEPGQPDFEASARNLRVLLVEDNLVNQKIAAAFLGMFGVDHALASDGREAVEMAALEAFDAILMDVQMPVMDGLEATKAIRAGGGINATTPIIGLTADAFDEQKRKGYVAGMSDYLTKPIDPRALAAAIARAVGAAGTTAQSAAEDGAIAG